MRNTRNYNTLKQVIDVLEKGQFPELVWVGKNYSKKDLIDDLRRIESKSRTPSFYD